MCARTVVRTPIEELAWLLKAIVGSNDIAAAQYNLAPTQPIPAVRLEGTKRILSTPRWGLIPSWVPRLVKQPPLINARCETLKSKPVFAELLLARRCLVLVDGYFEWRQQGGRKQPYLFQRRDGRPFAMAGLFNPGTKEKPASCVVITRRAIGSPAAIHDRMPAIVPESAHQDWLRRDLARPAVDAMLDRADLAAGDEMEHFAVNPVVNSVRAVGPQCVEPYVDGQRSLF